MTDEIRAVIEATAREAAKASRQEFEVVVERVDSKIDHVLEGLQMLDGKVDRRADGLEDGLRELTARVDVSVGERLSRLESEQATLAQRVSRIEAQLGDGGE